MMNLLQIAPSVLKGIIKEPDRCRYECPDGVEDIINDVDWIPSSQDAINTNEDLTKVYRDLNSAVKAYQKEVRGKKKP